jgi:hypothetical protein
MVVSQMLIAVNNPAARQWLFQGVVPRLFTQISAFGTTTSSGSHRAGGRVGGESGRLPRGYNAANAFALYVKEQKPARGTQATKAIAGIASQWHSLNPHTKAQYAQNAKKLAQDRRNRYALLPTAEKTRLAAETKARNLARVRTIIRKFKEATDHPKPIRTTFAAFYKQYYARNAPSHVKFAQVAPIMQRAANEWSTLSAAEKQKYKDAYARHSNTYAAERRAWLSRNADAIQRHKLEILRLRRRLGLAPPAPPKRKLVARKKKTAGKRRVAAAKRKTTARRVVKPAKRAVLGRKKPAAAAAPKKKVVKKTTAAKKKPTAVRKSATATSAKKAAPKKKVTSAAAVRKAPLKRSSKK